jgi:hypothetical protein
MVRGVWDQMSNTTRRRLLTTVVGAGTGLMLTAKDGALIARGATTPAADSTATAVATGSSTRKTQVDAPAWSFALNSLDDPFTGKLVFPKVSADNRVVRAEVIVINASDQPLDVQIAKVHLVDTEGIEYSAGNAQGSDPSLVSQTLPNGERSRGFVWFVIPADAELAQIKFIAPAPQLRIPIGTK